MTGDQLLKIADVAELLNVSPRTVERWRLQGEGPPAVKLGAFVRFRRDDVAAWIDDNREAIVHHDAALSIRRRRRA